MTIGAPEPPNQNYKISPTTFTPEPMQFDLGKIAPETVCPTDGGKLVRVGSNPPFDIRCTVCGAQGSLV